MKFLNKRKIFLGIETTTKVFSVALGDGNVVFAQKKICSRIHSEKLIPEIKTLLKITKSTAYQINAIVVGVGPGSFTGIRMGLSCGITFAQILKIPIYGISSLDISGRNIKKPVLKAYRDKYYFAEYSEEGCRLSDFSIIDYCKKEKIGATLADISAVFLLNEVKKLYEKNIDGNWRRIEPIYVMNTVYEKKG